MLSNTKLISFVNRVASDNDLRAALDVDFEGTLSANGLALSSKEIESLRASYGYIRGVNPTALERRIAAGGGSC